MEILSSLIKGGNSDTCYIIWMNLENIMLREIGQPQKDECWMMRYHLNEVPRVVKFKEDRKQNGSCQGLVGAGR